MADALSIAASIVALLQASGAVVQYLKSSKDANKDIQALKIEVINVRGLIYSLKDLVPDPEADEDSSLPVFESLGGQDGPLKQFETILAELALRLRPKEGLKKTGQALSWHFKKEDVKSLIGTVERYKTLFSLALQNDQLNLSRMLSNNVTSLKQDAVQIKTGVLDLQKTQEDEHRHKVIRWFSSVDVSTNHYVACNKREPSTGDWFIRSPDFVRWKIDPGGFLWLYGFAGSGKTVLCSTVIQEIKQLVDADSTKVLAYFYFDFRDKEKQNVPDFLCSLIAQVLNGSPILPNEINTLYQGNDFQKPPSDITALKRMLRSLLIAQEAVYIVADALDECIEREELLLVLSEMADMKSQNLHILVTSRQERDILEGLETVVTGTIGLEGSKIDKDIAVHVHSQVIQHPKLKRWPDSVKSNIEETLVAKAQGMFRWVFCQLNALKTCRKESTLRERLDQLPKDLDETYDRILQNIMDEDANEAFAALQWLAYSERPLYLDELAEAIVIKPNIYSLESRDRLLDPYEVLHICSSLVVLDNEDIQERDEEYGQYIEPLEEHARKVVSFAHFSIKEYLISDRIRKGPSSRFGVSAHAAHAFIGQMCLSYLLAFNKDDSLTENPLEAFPLIEYAGRSWPNHIRIVENNPAFSGKTGMLALGLLHSRSFAFLNWLRVSDPDRGERNHLGLPRLDYDFYDVGPPIYYASLLHLPVVARGLLDSGADINERGGGMGHALHAALCPLKSRTEINKAAAGQVGKVDKVKVATKDPRPIMVELLLDHGADIEAKNGSGSSVLYMAVANGQEEVVRLLIYRGADVRSRRQYGMTALQNAALYGREEIVRLLLDKGADIEAKDARDGRNGATVLCAVARFGNAPMVKLLLERGANIEAKDDQGRTALHYATQDGRKDTVQLLLERGADIVAKDITGRAAIHHAAVNGDEEVIQLLLEKDADISAKDDKGQTALHLASIERRGEAVKLLVDRGADIREEDSAGCTALQYAAPTREMRVKVFDAIDNGM